MNLNLYGISCGQGRAHVVVCTVSFATAFGCLSLTMQLLLFRKNHARFACSVVNALTTAHCRYQLLRILYNFSRELSYFINNLTAAASHRPTVWNIKFNLCVQPPFTQGGLNMRLSVNLTLYVFCCGQGQGLSLRYDI